MKLIEGKLKRLGESTVNMRAEVVKYSLIQIGDKTLTNLKVSRKLNNFLQDGIETELPTKLWMTGGLRREVMAVQVGDDTRYYNLSVGGLLFFTALHFSITAMAFNLNIGFGLFLLVMGLVLYVPVLLDCFRIAGMGGTKV
ncbi:hypothetical protein [Variovorax sp. N23]|uniref:hypothetical protein n=1 Tax=Variovorax sp. N23 TaxID=2980555 RepID=UPI0021C76839|nr:hypothetical protein [Variovorax sp. N23]MCU4118428.1 hypothetical protein [Variovorax sp. N23]